jgi:hypothetical protein
VTARRGQPSARIAAECGSPCSERVLVLQERIRELVATRQELRARAAGPLELEANRLALLQSQQQLSFALIGEHAGLEHERAAA